VNFRPIAIPLAAVLLGLVAGCEHPSMVDSARIGPFYSPINFTGVARLPYTVRRVVILPAAAGNLMPPETKDTLDPILDTALVRQQRFEVVAISRDELAKTFGFQEIASTDALPADFLQTLGEKFDAQGVLFVDVTSYFPYGPLRLGLRCKLADVKARGLLWSFDEVFTTSNPAIANGLRGFNLHSGRGNLPVDMSGDALSSPSIFADYVADTTFRTLPPP
jgi:hypothetical protein